jgi:hypothetical protein
MLQEISGRYHDVIATVAGEQLAFQHLVGIVDVIVDLDVKFPLELAYHGIVDVIRPVVDVENPLIIIV